MALRDRLPANETIAEFEAARFDRYHDGLVLIGGDRRVGAIYLFGYFVEMTLKSASFTLLGFQKSDPITKRELNAAATRAEKELGIDVPQEGYHSLQFWALAIVAERDHMGQPLPIALTSELNWRSQRMHSHWTIAMRYSRDVTRPEDWERLWEDSQWLHANYDILIAMNSPL